MSIHGISVKCFCNSYCVSHRFIVILCCLKCVYNAKVAYINLVICIAVQCLSDNSVRSVYFGYIYPYVLYGFALPMLLPFITL